MQIRDHDLSNSHRRRTRFPRYLPLLHQSRFIGILYLENKLAACALRAKQLRNLKLIASQAAIRLQSARRCNELGKREAKIRRLVSANTLSLVTWALDGHLLEATDAFERVPAPISAADSPLRALLDEVLLGLRNTLNDGHPSATERLRRAALALKGPRVRNPQGNGGLAPWQLRRVQALVETRLGEPISGQQLADCAGLSRCHFARAFRQSTGMSPRGYVLRRRIERAQHLMLSTQAALSDIALECGLADQSHFSRTFLKVCGTTPRAWRRAQTVESDGASPTPSRASGP